MENIRECYERNFKGNEREPWEKIQRRVKNGETIIIEVEHGAAILDWFEKSKTLLFIYLFIEEDYRGKGIGKQLFNKAKELVDEFGAECLLFETELPETSDYAEKRCKMFVNWGCKQIPITYYQPALSQKQEPERLILWTTKEFNVTAKQLKTFLFEFYGILGQLDTPNLISMLKEINEMP